MTSYGTSAKVRCPHHSAVVDRVLALESRYRQRHRNHVGIVDQDRGERELVEDAHHVEDEYRLVAKFASGRGGSVQPGGCPRTSRRCRD